jgi:Uma2 family endonuclease
MQAVMSKIPIERYLAIEQQGDVCLEYHHGSLYVKPSGAINHARLCGTVSYLLYRESKQQNTYQTFGSGMKIEVERAGRYVYPDATAVRTPLVESDVIIGSIANPTVIVEVLSKESGNYDRGPKMRYYLSLPSVREYLLIEQDRPAVSLYRRRASGNLGSFHYADGLEDSIELESIGITIGLAELYADINFPSPDQPIPGRLL